MIILDATTKSLQIVLDGAVTTSQLTFNASYSDVSQTNFAITGISSTDGTTNNTTAATLVSAPGSSKSRKVAYIAIYNSDSAAATVTVRVNNNGTLRIVVSMTLAVGDTLEYRDGSGWQVIDAQGQIQVTSPALTHTLLDGALHSDTVTQTVSRGSIIYGNSTPLWSELTVGAADTVLKSDGTDVAYGKILTANITDANVTLAKLANIATDSLIGRDTTGTGVPENILLNATLSMDGAGNLQRAALTGDVTAAAGSNATAIANNAVTNDDLRDSAALSVIGRSANSSGDPADIAASAASGAVLRESGSTLGFGTVATAGIANAAVTLAKIQNASANSKLLGSGAAGSGASYEELTLGTGLSMSGTTLNASASGGGLEQTFRGLHLRTSPNADVAATTVTLLRADQMTMDDGTVVDDWDDLSAVISSSGAGGLDTGAEAASTWYEIYAIRKSSDGTKNLLLHRAKDYFLDEQATTSGADQSLRDVSARTKIAQTFDTDETGGCPFIDTILKKVGTPTGRVWASIYATSGGNPTGAALKTSDKIDCSLISTSLQWIRFPFRDEQALTAGTTYALVFEGDFTIDGSNYLSLRHDASGGVYAAGSSFSFDGVSTWTDLGRDLAFKVYVTRNNAAVTMPAGYDQKCLIGYVYNDGSSNFNGFVAKDRNARYVKGLSVASVSANVRTLVDASTVVPPQPVEMFTDIQPSDDGATAQLAGVPDGFFAGNPGDGGAVLVNPGAAGGRVPAAVLTEYQGAYAAVGSGSVTVFVLGYGW